MRIKYTRGYENKIIWKNNQQPKIKEEVEPVQISDYGGQYGEFSFTGEPQYRSQASTSQGQAWAQHHQTSHNNEVGGKLEML